MKTGDQHWNWKGGKSKSSHGYVEVFSENSTWIHGKRSYEHRKVMELHLKRKLTSNEIVHHINHNKMDNRFENLQLLTRSKHIKIHNTLDNPAIEFKRMINQRITKLKLTFIRLFIYAGGYNIFKASGWSAWESYKNGSFVNQLNK